MEEVIGNRTDVNVFEKKSDKVLSNFINFTEIKIQNLLLHWQWQAPLG